ncbi:MAG: orotate phosphoribosyltransferase [Deltaproteobacteria bacterium]|nr:orotate phosphoribosyltransferase [Deltaproteobacteria bacterium]
MQKTQEQNLERLRLLLFEFAFEERDLTLASGVASKFYVDCKQVALTGEGHLRLGNAFYSLLKRVEGERPFVAVGGMSMGADPLCSATSLLAFQNGRVLNAVYVRKESKEHGTSAFLEGTKQVPAGVRLVVLEDVVTSGGSSLKAVQRLRNGGYDVDTVLTIVDRDAGGEALLKKENVALHSLFSLAQISKA